MLGCQGAGLVAEEECGVRSRRFGDPGRVSVITPSLAPSASCLRAHMGQSRWGTTGAVAGVDVDVDVDVAGRMETDEWGLRREAVVLRALEDMAP